MPLVVEVDAHRQVRDRAVADAGDVDRRARHRGRPCRDRHRLAARELVTHPRQSTRRAGRPRARCGALPLKASGPRPITGPWADASQPSAVRAARSRRAAAASAASCCKRRPSAASAAGSGTSSPTPSTGPTSCVGSTGRRAGATASRSSSHSCIPTTASASHGRAFGLRAASRSSSSTGSSARASCASSMAAARSSPTTRPPAADARDRPGRHRPARGGAVARPPRGARRLLGGRDHREVPRGVIERWNRGAQELFGYPPRRSSAGHLDPRPAAPARRLARILGQIQRGERVEPLEPCGSPRTAARSTSRCGSR